MRPPRGLIDPQASELSVAAFDAESCPDANRAIQLVSGSEIVVDPV